jgi:HEPN domain-containing protein
LTLLSNSEPGLTAILAEAAILTTYAVEYRYPGDYPDITRKDAEEALEIAGRVRQAVLQRLPKDILS